MNDDRDLGQVVSQAFYEGWEAGWSAGIMPVRGNYYGDEDAGPDPDFEISRTKKALGLAAAKYSAAVEVAEAADAHHEAERSHGLNSTQEARAHRALMDSLARYHRAARDATAATQGDHDG